MSMAQLNAGPVIGDSIAPLVPDIYLPNPPKTEVPPLPASFPAHIPSELAWKGSDFKHGSEYVYHLTEADLGEITSAITLFKTLELDGHLVSRDTFPLPALGAKLDKLSQDVHNGRGFCLIRGIQPDNFSVEDLMLVYLGVQAYIADQRGRQDSRGNMLVHIVADKSSETRGEHHRHSNKSITFHNEEAGDVVSWMTKSTAAAGGKCIIASAYTIYNTLAARRPDLIRILARSDWPFALPRFQCRPILFHKDSKLIMNFGRAPLLGNAAHPRPSHLPSINANQLEALDAIQAIAQATQLEIQTRPGDMHFINNLAVLHRREGFVDGSAAEEKRHLIRMRLRSSHLGWDLPDDLKREWFEAFEKQSRRVWHLEPKPDAYFPLRKYPN